MNKLQYTEWKQMEYGSQQIGIAVSAATHKAAQVTSPCDSLSRYHENMTMKQKQKDWEN
jgi:hypothetical protein